MRQVVGPRLIVIGTLAVFLLVMLDTKDVPALTAEQIGRFKPVSDILGINFTCFVAPSNFNTVGNIWLIRPDGSSEYRSVRNNIQLIDEDMPFGRFRFSSEGEAEFGFFAAVKWLAAKIGMQLSVNLDGAFSSVQASNSVFELQNPKREYGPFDQLVELATLDLDNLFAKSGRTFDFERFFVVAEAITANGMRLWFDHREVDAARVTGEGKAQVIGREAALGLTLDGKQGEAAAYQYDGMFGERKGVCARFVEIEPKKALGFGGIYKIDFGNVKVKKDLYLKNAERILILKAFNPK